MEAETLSPQEVLRRARRVELRAARLVTDAMVGAYLSRFKGRGTDFEELREYIPGDDVRSIDWNVTARTGRPFVRLHREERELGLILAVDISGSSSFGSSDFSIRERAAEVAAILGLSALRAGDKVGLLLFSDHAEHWIPPRKGRRQVLRVVRDILERPATSRRTAFAAPLRRLARAARRRSSVFVLSDFHPGPEGAEAMVAALGQLNARHDVACIHLVDERTRELPDAGRITLEDTETGELVEVNTHDASVRAQYATQATERLTAIETALRRAQIDTLRLVSTVRPAPALARFLENRKRRR